jgi:hypothetical protein
MNKDKRENKFTLGLLAKDKITGFTGTMTGFCRYLTGCDQYLLSPSVDKDGKHVEARWFDENRLNIFEDSEKIELNTENDTDKGACESAPMY